MRPELDDPGRSIRIVARDVGALQVLLSAGMLASLLVSLLYREYYTALSFLASAALSAGAGGAAYIRCRDAGDPERRHAMIIAGAGWLVAAAFGSLPFVFAAYWTPEAAAQAFVPAGETYASSLSHFRNPLHAFFESMSAYTTTGLTMAVHEPSIGHGLLFYRSLAQWIGGVGVIVLSLAIIPRPHVSGELELYRSEAAGMKLRPSILGTAREIWKIYAALTAGVIVYLFAATLILLPGYGAGRALFDAVNHAMAGLATGGFSPLDDSIATYKSWAMELVHIPPMLLGATSIPLYFAFVRERGDARVFWRDPQFRSMLFILGALIPLLALLLRHTPEVPAPLREGLFQAVSGLSGTGWQTSNIGAWSGAAALLLAWGGMIVSGAAGSTVGGIKLIRAYLFYRAAAWKVQKVFLPAEAVVPFRVGERSLSAEPMRHEVSEAAVFSLFYLVILGVSTIAVAHLAGPGFTLADVIFECVSAQSTVGLSSGITDPGMPAAIELVFILQMWVGRLEIFPVIILLRALIAWTVRR